MNEKPNTLFEAALSYVTNKRRDSRLLLEWYENPPAELPQSMADEMEPLKQYRLGHQDAMAEVVEYLEALEKKGNPG